jgi:ATP-binding cassette, subfamily B, bacterial
MIIVIINMKYLKLLYRFTKGYRTRYLLSFGILFFALVFLLLANFSTKILVDTLQGIPPSGPIDTFLTNLLGGQLFLRANLWLIATLIIFLGFSRALMFFSRLIIRGSMDVNLGRDIQLDLFYHIERLPYSYIKKNKSGDLIQTCTRDLDIVRNFLVRQVNSIVYTIFLVTIAFNILLTVSWQIAISSTIILPFMFIYSYALIKRVRKLFKVTEDSDGMVSAKIEETLSGIRLVKAYNNETYEIKDFKEHLQDYRKKFIKWRLTSSFFFASTDIMVFGQIALTSAFGVYLAATGNISVGTFVVALQFVGQVVWPVRDVAMTLSNLAQAMASLDRLNTILNQPLEDIESGLRPTIKGAISFSNMSFHYDDTDEVVIKDFSLTINPGETVAIMGKTGSGKSTLSHLLTRLYDYTSGSIKVDGHELKDIAKDHIRRQIATVLQEPFLFSKTIINNLKIANSNASEEDIQKAAQIADIHHSIINFKDGYDTRVGEKGVTLSGGQKQRLVIARTIISKAPILVFDDSLSAVDTETDINIRTALKKRQEQSTTLIITHRVATAKDADKIIVLEHGKIAEMGTHDQLIKKSGLYRRIFDIQTRMV